MEQISFVLIGCYFLGVLRKIVEPYYISLNWPAGMLVQAITTCIYKEVAVTYYLQRLTPSGNYSIDKVS